MQKLLAVAVLGATLAFTASAALADEGRYEPANQPTQTQMVRTQDESSPSTVAGGSDQQLPAVDTTRENGNNR